MEESEIKATCHKEVEKEAGNKENKKTEKKDKKEVGIKLVHMKNTFRIPLFPLTLPKSLSNPFH